FTHFCFNVEHSQSLDRCNHSSTGRLADSSAHPTLEAMSRRRVITIGNFDGVHRGHRALIALARRLAGDDGQVVARPFEPHPRTILHPDRPAVARLTTDRDRERLLREAGATDVRRLAATADLLAMPPDQFASWLVDQDHPDVVVEGPNFRF